MNGEQFERLGVSVAYIASVVALIFAPYYVAIYADNKNELASFGIPMTWLIGITMLVGIGVIFYSIFMGIKYIWMWINWIKTGYWKW